jgi:hypothetical protein
MQPDPYMARWEGLAPGEDWAAWGARTGRYFQRDVPRYRKLIASRVMASAGADDGGEAYIRMMYPALAGQNGSLVQASAGADAYAELYGDGELDREVERLSPPRPGQRVAAAAPRSSDAYEELYGDPLDREVARLSPPRPGEHRGTPVAAAYVHIGSGPPTTSWANYVEECRSQRPDLVAAAEGDGEAPELFAGSGDYPSATASGLPADAIEAVLPWRARLAIASEPNQARAYQLLQDYAGDDPGLEDEARMNLARHGAVKRHMNDVEVWLHSSGISPDLRRQQAVVASSGDLDEYGFTPAEYEALYGPRR